MITGARSVAAGLTLAIALVACGGDGTEDAASPGPSPTSAPTVATGVGVTAEPCPDGDEDRGCIYLGVLSDLSEGPFLSFGAAVTDGMRAFWQRVNDEGGIAGYDVDVNTYTRDDHYDVATHLAALDEIEPFVLAIAQSLGTEPTLAARETLDANDLVTIPASFWSGWDLDPLFLPSGYSYCVESMDALDHAAAEAPVTSVMSVHFDDLYGRDSLAGVARWAEANGVAFDPAIDAVTTAPTAAGDQDAAVEAVLARSPDVVVVATGPFELGELAGKLASQDFAGRLVGSGPTFSPALLDDATIATALAGRYAATMPWEPWGGTSDAHHAMELALGGELPPNDGFTSGWVWSYPLLDVLREAASAGDLTRAGVRAAVGRVTVDYEGALPSRSYDGTRPGDPVRGAVVVAPDTSAPLGLRPLTGLEVGATARAADLPTACAAADAGP